jgi:hypothetical protein
MRAESKFLMQPLDFWANVKFISQKIGYTERKTSQIKVPTYDAIQSVYSSLNLDSSKLIDEGVPTKLGSLLLEYFQHRSTFLNYGVEPNLMNKDQARELFEKLHKELQPLCPIPMNKQSSDKKAPSYFTAIINMLIEANVKGYDCNYNPQEITAFTRDDFPIRSLSRRVDGTFPNVINPVAIWEIKEYYNTKSFGSRIADGVYETLLDGYELDEARKTLDREIHHYLMVDDYGTWWEQGKPYLCRICDMLHMGLVTEVLFGREILIRLPEIASNWIIQLNQERNGF